MHFHKLIIMCQKISENPRLIIMFYNHRVYPSRFSLSNEPYFIYVLYNEEIIV